MTKKELLDLVELVEKERSESSTLELKAAKGGTPSRLYKDAVFDTNENPGPRHPEAENIKKSRAFTVLPVHSAEL